MARELRDASHFGTGVVLMVVGLDVQHSKLLWGDVHASSEEAGCDAALINITLNHFGSMERIERVWRLKQERPGEAGCYMLPDLPSCELDEWVQLRHVGAQIFHQFNSIT
jgi:hypothetical protein